MGSLLVVSGPPGAGKSTVAGLLADRLSPSALVGGDAFFRFLRSGIIEPWRVDARVQNEAIMQIQAAAADSYRGAGYETVYDGVVGPWFLPTFAANAGEFDFVILLPSIETCLHRIATRHGHEFDDEAAARSLHRQFAEACAGRADLYVLDTSDATPEHSADHIDSARRAGRLTVRQAA